jgi:hypothetical protein
MAEEAAPAGLPGDVASVMSLYSEAGLNGSLAFAGALEDVWDGSGGTKGGRVEEE